MSEIKVKRIALGSGKIFCIEFTGAIPTDEKIEQAENILGLIQGGASLEYKPESYTAEDDLGLVSKTIITKEEALLKAGICTFNGDTLGKLASTARVTTSADGKRRTVKIGGRGKDNRKRYLLRFLHEDPVDGDVRVTIVGRNEAGLTLAYAKDKETIINPEFKAHPHDEDGTLIIYDEEIVEESAAEEAAVDAAAVDAAAVDAAEEEAENA